MPFVAISYSVKLRFPAYFSAISINSVLLQSHNLEHDLIILIDVSFNNSLITVWFALKLES